MGYIFSPERIPALIKALKHEFGGDFSVTFDSVPRTTIKVTIRDRGQDIAGFTMEEHPRCCGIMDSVGTFVVEEYRGKGIAHEMMMAKEYIAKEFGYTLMMATVDMNNAAEIHILEKFGWVKIYQFDNRRSTHTVGIYIKEVKLK